MAITENYFSADNLLELAQIDEHMFFLDSLSKKYCKMDTYDHAESEATQCNWSEISEQLNAIQAKKKDKKINLSVIGEFSTGKSTFINALIGKDLLASSALQGTTVASTIIEYGPKYILNLEYLDNRPKVKKQYASFEGLRAELQLCTTDPVIARSLKSVDVFLPLDILRNNFRIIDTPGTNVTDAWHEDVTIRTIREQSDLSIILISAEKQLTKTMQNFVNSYLMNILPQCIFVVTKIDLIRPRERATILSYIQGKVEDAFSLDCPVVLPFASTLVLAQGGFSQITVPTCDDKVYSDETLFAKSGNSLQTIVRHTEEQKNIAITKKLTLLLDQSYKLLSDNLNSLSTKYECKLALLTKSKKADLTEYVDKLKATQLRTFDEKTRIIRDEFETEIDKMINTQKSWLLERLDACSTTDTLKIYIDQNLADECLSCANNVIKEKNRYWPKLQGVLRSGMKHFNDSFEKYYDELEIFHVYLEMTEPPSNIQVKTADLSTTAEYIAKALSEENSTFLSGAALGATVGTAIAPGPGTIIGGVVGFLFGGAITPSADDIRSNCKSKLRPQLNNYFDSVSVSMNDALDRYTNQLRSCFSKEMDAYIPRYRDEVTHQITEVVKQRAQVSQKTRSLSLDKQNMLNRMERLESVMTHLNQIGRKESG